MQLLFRLVFKKARLVHKRGGDGGKKDNLFCRLGKKIEGGRGQKKRGGQIFALPEETETGGGEEERGV